MIAAQSNHVPVIEFLLKMGAKLEARDWNGDSALTLAAYAGHAEAVQVRIILVVVIVCRHIHLR